MGPTGVEIGLGIGLGLALGLAGYKLLGAAIAVVVSPLKGAGTPPKWKDWLQRATMIW